jgi:hypothetical protein
LAEVHWELARAWGAAAEGDRLVLAAVFDGLNRYLGNFVGEFLGELSFSVFFVLSGFGLLRHERAPRWLSWWGIATGVPGLIGMWRNVTPAVDAVAAANNYTSARMDDRLWRVACRYESQNCSWDRKLPRQADSPIGD